MFWMLRTLMMICLGGTLLAASATAPAAGQDVRRPVWAGRFYPADASELGAMLRKLTAAAGRTPVEVPAGRPLRGLVLPHAGYVYSGLTAAHASHVLHRNQFDQVILMGPDHRVGFTHAAVSAVRAYQTPLGPVRLAPGAERLRREADIFRAIPASDRKEHSLEVVLPFLQYYLGSFELIPIVLGPCDASSVAAAIDHECDARSLVVVSSDLSHFLPYEQAVAKDHQTIKMILDLEGDRLLACADCACGRNPLAVMLQLARRHAWDPVLLHYSNSGDTAGDRRRVVGYAAIAFYGK